MGVRLGDALELYQRCVSSEVVEYLQRQTKVKSRNGIYTVPVVLWLMVVQWLTRGGTLATTVAALLGGVADPLLSNCRRAQQKRISRRTGGYSQARQKLPKLLCKQVFCEMVSRLRKILHPEEGRQAYILDGSSLELEASPSLRKSYPPAENQHGRAHWPVLRLVVAHELETGLAELPQFGPMYGSAAVSEQELAEKTMAGLPSGAIVVGDRNFGVFSIAWAAQQRSLAVVIRLTQPRAQKLAGGPIQHEGEQLVKWEATRFDRRRLGGMAAGASVEGRLITTRIGRGKSKQWLHLFTTAALSAKEITTLYGRRWCIETDLRSVKRTVCLHHISARQESMMEKELYAAMAAYNLVRAVMALAARRHGLSPRQLSFSFVYNVVNAHWDRVRAAAPNEEAYRQEVFNLLDIAAQGKHPNRKKRRPSPRAVWHRRHTFPARKESSKA